MEKGKVRSAVLEAVGPTGRVGVKFNLGLIIDFILLPLKNHTHTHDHTHKNPKVMEARPFCASALVIMKLQLNASFIKGKGVRE